MLKEDWAESQLCQLTQSSTSTPWELWECKKVRGCCSKKKNAADILVFKMSGMSWNVWLAVWRGLWSLQSARADCDLCLLPGTCKFSIPHIGSSTVLHSHERLKFLRIFEKHRSNRGRSAGGSICFVLTRILYRYTCFLCISYEHELKYSTWEKCYFS